MGEAGVDEVVVLVRDLMSASRITPVLASRGVRYRWIRSPEGLSGVPAGVRLVLVDCHLPDSLAAVTAYKGRSPGTRVVGFASHTDGQTIAQAREAGVDRVLARSAVFDRIASLLEEAP